MNTIEIWIMFVISPSFIHSPEASAALADLSCARSVVSGLRSPRSWDVMAGTSSTWWEHPPLVWLLESILHVSNMLLKVIWCYWSLPIISWWFWNDVGWLKIIKHHLKSLNLNIIKLIKHPNDPPFLGPYPTWTQACSPAGPWRWSQHLVEGQDLSRLKWKATVKSHGFYHGFYMLKAS